MITEKTDIKESILNSVKKLLGIPIDLHEFDPDIIMNINAAIYTLRQIGVGPEEGFIVASEEETYEDFLGEGNKEIPQVKMYLFYKTKLSFDPPTSGTVIECMKEFIKEAECRLSYQVDPCDVFISEKKEDNPEDIEEPDIEPGEEEDDGLLTIQKGIP